jgi:hypothetical protein
MEINIKFASRTKNLLPHLSAFHFPNTKREFINGVRTNLPVLYAERKGLSTSGSSMIVNLATETFARRDS